MKRIFDLAASSLATLVLTPLLLLLVIWIKLDSPGPVIFRQKRVGQDNRFFWIYKFRTMHPDTPDIPTHLLTDPATYVTRAGKWLRKYSLDELPQLINIIKGEMSIVGPRPALYNQADLIEARTKLGISALRPGLTGYAQINGRDEVSIEEKVSLDYVYLQRAGFFFDMLIIWRTVLASVMSRGVRS